ncbi:hypothetical protein BCT76_00785 [Vibrio tasmaniensis]|nr:hypothetical protein BCT83_11335 [Vibrio tasmaniensis]PML52430.1 hypothetical protein BCT76_00785 [Vibrio tasmaniensis]
MNAILEALRKNRRKNKKKPPNFDKQYLELVTLRYAFDLKALIIGGKQKPERDYLVVCLGFSYRLLQALE